ncbi:MAG: 2-C-methyl-D-erythritol 4-phosphate cytidylyltransferase [Deltaproteobacteria bacterium]|nr:2-C-methyl-D-erythritol 4-phosphate cytidylyltransferase [Deltaproteobacteria bacterium]
MGPGAAKNYLPLLNKPVIAYTLKAFEASPLIISIVAVVSPGDEESFRQGIVLQHGIIRKAVRIIAGGAERQSSVANALKTIEGYSGVIAVHDGARPLVTPALIERTIKEAAKSGAAICAVRPKDTVKTGRDNIVTGTIDRAGLWSVQTPQAFRAPLLFEAFRKAGEDGFSSTDESALVERLGIEVRVVEGSYENIKITTKEDLIIAECILMARGNTSK